MKKLEKQKQLQSYYESDIRVCRNCENCTKHGTSKNWCTIGKFATKKRCTCDLFKIKVKNGNI
jgi:hypothetical protein